jgi:uncharacterized membrane protein
MLNKSIVAMVAGLLVALGAPTQADAWFRFTNSTAKPVYVTFQWYSPGCKDGGSWETQGWWLIQPGATATVFGRDLQTVDEYFYFYAESNDRRLIWSGPYKTCCPSTAFDWCLNTCNNNPNTRVLGFREINIGSYNNYTLNLIP